MRRSSTAWKRDMRAFLDGVESELRPSAPATARAALQDFRDRLDHDKTARRRKGFWQDLDALLGRDPFLRAAAKRYLSKKMHSALTKAFKAQIEAERVLKQLESKKRQSVN
jgi:hypothetical protein